MKLSIDTEAKTIEFEGEVKFHELVDAIAQNIVSYGDYKIVGQPTFRHTSGYIHVEGKAYEVPCSTVAPSK